MAKHPKSRSENRADKLQREQEALSRVFRIFLIGIAAECYVLFMYARFVKGNAQQLLTAVAACKWIGWLGAAAAAAGLVLLVVKKQDRQLRRGGLWVFGTGLFLALSSAMMYFLFPQGSLLLCVAIPIFTVFGLIYYLFQHEFFLSCVILGGAMFTLWVLRRGLGSVSWSGAVIAGAVVVLAGLAAAAALTFQISKKDGKWPFKGSDVRLFSPGCPYKVLYATYAAAFAVILLAMALPASIFYTMWGMGILLFGLAVYYTTKLM